MKLTETLTIGQSTAALLQSLRSIEIARNYYLKAWEENGEEVVEAIAKKAAPLFDAVRDLVQSELAEDIQLWATSSDSNEV